MTAVVRTSRITSKAALAAVQAAVRAGLEMGVNINVAVVDVGGNLLAFLRADSAFLPSIAIAQDKAYTAVGFGMSSGKLYGVLKDDVAVCDGIAKQPRVALFSGGLPIVFNDEVIGGIGVSGASAEQDELCAMAGIAATGLKTHEEG